MMLSAHPGHGKLRSCLKALTILHLASKARASTSPSDAEALSMSKRVEFMNMRVNSLRHLKKFDGNRIDGHMISADSFENVRASDQPVLLASAVELGRVASVLPLQRDVFIAAFGHLDEMASNGYFGPTRKTQMFNVANHLLSEASDFKFFHTGCTELQRQVWNQTKPIIPDFLDDFAARPVLSAGPKAATSAFHVHDETWFALLAGRKAWWVGDQISVNRLSDVDPLALSSLSSHTGIKFFVQEPGDLVYLPGMLPHATCNLDTFNLGIGAQGHMETWPAVPRAANKGDANAVMQLVMSGEDLHAKNPEGQSSLDRAVLNEDLNMVQFLLEQRANPNGLIHGMSTLHLAVAKSAGITSGKGSPDAIARSDLNDYMVDILLLHRANPNATEPKAKQTPLHVAAEYGKLQVAKALVRAGGHLYAKANHGTQPFHHAAMGGRLSILKWLVEEHNVDIDAISDTGHTAAHWSAGYGHVDFLDYLQNFGADLDKPDPDGATPLDHAEAEGRQAAAVYLSGKQKKQKKKEKRHKENTSRHSQINL